MFTERLFQIELHLLGMVLLSGFQSSMEASKFTEIGSKLQGSGKHNKCNCLENRANFHRFVHGKLCHSLTLL